MSIVDRTNYLFSGISVIIAFWGLFWLLNGMDKIFNGTFEPNINSYATKYVAIPNNGQDTISFSLYPMEPKGWFGVNRDAKMIGYFKRLNLNEDIAIGSLYLIASLEILLGLSFLFDLFTRRKHFNLIRLNFKLTMLIFFGFTIFDILFGDRMELWEHGTFLILATIHFVYILFGVPGKEFDNLREAILNVSSQGKNK
jgi:hypothetical protein